MLRFFVRGCASAASRVASPSVRVGSASRALSFRRSLLPALGVRTYASDTARSETGADAESEPSAPAPAAETGEVDAEVRRIKDSYLLLLADMENLRERTRREVAAAGQYAIQRFAKDVLSIVDVLEMASAGDAASAGSAPESGTLADGVRMTLEEARRVLARHGVAEIAAEGARFDPNVHEALYEVPAEGGAAPGTVVAVAKRGYTLHGRVIRPAQVGVSRGA